MEQLKEFQKKIGYQFQQEGLLRQALTHSSYANEHRMKKLSDNERLEFLGDAVLEIVTSDFYIMSIRMCRRGTDPCACKYCM